MSTQQNQGEPAVALLMLLALIAGFSWLFWYATGDFWLDTLFRYLRYGQLWLVNQFTHDYDACLSWLKLAQVDDKAPTPYVVQAARQCFGAQYLSAMKGQDSWQYYQLSSRAMTDIGVMTESFYRWPFACLLVVIALFGIISSPYYMFMTKHSLESLIVTQAKMWPIISPIVKFNPSKSGRILGDKIPNKLPMFAEALSPEEWISWCRISVVNGIPDREATRRAFIKQLGPRWTGISSLPWHMKALLAAFALKGVQRREESDVFLGRLAECWSPKGGFRPSSEMRAEIDKIIKDPKIGGAIAPVLDKHAWRTTAMLGALRWARNNGGVLAPAQFLWIRAEDRALWYPLNNLGRRAFHSEGAGALAHFMAEETAKKPLPIPRVDTAVVTLNTYLHDPDKRSIKIPEHE